MSAALVTLDKEDLAKRIRDCDTFLENHRGQLESVKDLKALFARKDQASRGAGCNRNHFLLIGSLSLARLEHANGAPASRVREILQEGVSAFEPIVPCFDYTPYEIHCATHLSKLKEYRGRPDVLEMNVLGPDSRAMNYHKIRLKMRNQPATFDMAIALQAALVAWDFKRAHAMAAAYNLSPAFKEEGPNQFGLLREAILENTKGALAFLENIPNGYAAGFPPPRRELAEGVIRGDAGLIRKGLKIVSTRFRSTWTLKTYCTPAKLKRFGTVEKMLPEIRRYLFGSHWLMSEWAIAWMSLAWHRGMKDAFSEPELFSKWVPWELCCPEPKPGGTKLEKRT